MPPNTIRENIIVKKLKIRHLQNLSTLKNPTMQYLYIVWITRYIYDNSEAIVYSIRGVPLHCSFTECLL